MSQAWRVGLWCAVSSKAQAASDKISLQEQEQAGRRFADSIGGQVVALFIVPGHSRDVLFWQEAEEQMDAYRQVRQALEAGALDVLHVVDGDRLGRDPALVAQFQSLAARNGCEIYNAAAPHTVGQRQVGHRYLDAILAVRAGEDQAIRKERHKMGMKGRVAKRGLMAGIPPFGYAAVRDDSGKTVNYKPDENASSIVYMTDLYLQGLTYAEIARRLNASHHRPAHARLWSFFTVWQTLNNDAYAGLPSWGVYHYEGEPRYEVLWDADTYDRILVERSRRGRMPKRRKTSGPFAGVAYCATCGNRMIYQRTKWKDSTYYYLRCGLHHRRANMQEPDVCDGKGVPLRLVIQKVGEFLSTIASPEEVAESLSASNQPDRERLSRELDGALREVARLEQQRERLALALARGDMDGQMYRKTDDALEDQLGRSGAQAESLQNQLAHLPNPVQRRQAIAVLVDGFYLAVAMLDHATVAKALQEAGIRVWCRDGGCRVELV